MCTLVDYVVIWIRYFICIIFFFQAEDGIRDLVRSRGLGDVYKRQVWRHRSLYRKNSSEIRNPCRVFQGWSVQG